MPRNQVVKVLNKNVMRDAGGHNIGFGYIHKELMELIELEKNDKANQSLADLIPKARNLQVANMLIDGYTTKEIKKELLELGYSESSANRLINQAARAMERKYVDMLEDAAENNMKRLHQLIYEAAQDGDRATVLKAIDLQNKMANLYQNKLEIKAQNELIINIDGEQL